MTTAALPKPEQCGEGPKRAVTARADVGYAGAVVRRSGLRGRTSMGTYQVRVGAVQRDLNVVNVGSVSVALLNLRGDARLPEAAVVELVRLIPQGTDCLVTPEVKAVPLAHAMSVRTGLPYVVARKTEKPF